MKELVAIARLKAATEIQTPQWEGRASEPRAQKVSPCSKPGRFTPPLSRGKS